ncbi:type II secretion system F family protein [Microbacterium halophytorum]|uniref:type II secretion system F family protein n=1 Tax=Microbacterium halophytorum TaxID=2067568 RepID=UPI000CFC483B|nr:type II secretion system F family protein [Microbacterium halophytorum]
MSGASDIALAVLLGGALGAGLWTVLAAMPRWGAVPLERRIAPYIRDVTDPAGTTAAGSASDPGSAIAGAGGALWRAARLRATALLGGTAAVARRLERAGLGSDAAAFRGRQLAWGLAGALAGGVLLVAVAMAGRFAPPAALVPLLGAAAGALGCDAALTSRAKARARRIADELPTVLEFLALCLAAGEGILDSIRRVADVGTGELTGELRRVVVEVGTGEPLAGALTGMARRVDVPALSRATDHLVAALERGAPLAQALQAQAGDAREEAKRTLIEQAGKREIWMLVVLVFAILPLSVVFALLPGITMLNVGL